MIEVRPYKEGFLNAAKTYPRRTQYASSATDVQQQVVHAAVQQIKQVDQSAQFLLMGREMHEAGESIRRRETVLFLSVDDTPAGDIHHIAALYEPEENAVIIEIPDEPSDVLALDGQRYSRKGGRFPTVLHAVEMVVVAFNLAEGANITRANSGDSRDTEYPSLNFVRKDADDALPFRVLEKGIDRTAVAIIPLTYQPDTSNVLVFNKNAKGRDINPMAIAQAHYDAIQADSEIANVLLRHTMLLEGAVEGGNKVFEIGVMEDSETKQHKLFRTARLDNAWIQPMQEPTYLGETKDSSGRIRRRYSLNQNGGAQK